jgi:hypothetical protein
LPISQISQAGEAIRLDPPVGRRARDGERLLQCRPGGLVVAALEQCTAEAAQRVSLHATIADDARELERRAYRFQRLVQQALPELELAELLKRDCLGIAVAGLAHQRQRRRESRPRAIDMTLSSDQVGEVAQRDRFIALTAS